MESPKRGRPVGRSPAKVHVNTYLTVEDVAWLKAQPGGVAAAVRRLIAAARERPAPPEAAPAAPGAPADSQRPAPPAAERPQRPAPAAPPGPFRVFRPQPKPSKR